MSRKWVCDNCEVQFDDATDIHRETVRLVPIKSRGKTFVFQTGRHICITCISDGTYEPPSS